MSSKVVSKSVPSNGQAQVFPEVMSVSEVCKVLHVSCGSVHRLIERGTLRAVRVGNLFRVYRDSVQKLLPSE